MTRTNWALALAALAGCRTSGPAELGPHAPTALTEVQAELVIEQTLLASGTVLRKHEAASLQGVGTTEVDFVFGEPARGIEWLSAADLDSSGPQSWPPPDPTGPLRVVTGTLGDGAPVQVLLLHAQDYMYERNPRWVQRGAPGIDALEAELGDDVAEFLEFVAAEDTPLGAP